MGASVQADRIRRIAVKLTRVMQVVGVLILLFSWSFLSSLVGYVRDAVRMRTWEEVPVTVVEAEYRKHPNDEDPHFFAKYRYRYRDAEYSGTAVENRGPYLTPSGLSKETAGDLMRHLREGTPAVGYVNPDRPDESALRRDFSYVSFSVLVGMFSATAAGGAAFFGLGTARRRRLLAERRQAELHPNEPWLWRDDWANGSIRSISRADTRMLTAVAAFYLFVVLPLGLLILRELQKPVLSVPGVILLVVAWGLFNLARQKRRQGKRLDVAEFRPASVPGLVGGPLAGVVTIPAGFPSDTGYRVRLECTKNVGNDSGGPVVLWRDTTTVERTIDSGDPFSTAVPIYFAIPYDCTPCDPDQPEIHWRLRVGPEKGYVEDDAAFEVPVYRTAASSPRYQPDPKLMESYERVVRPDEAIAASGCTIHTLFDGREELKFSLFRLWVLCAAGVMIGGCAALIVAVIHFQWHWGWAVMPALFGVLVSLGTLEMLFWGSRLRIGPAGIEVSTGYPIFRRRQTLRVDEIIDVETELEFAMERGDKFRVILIPRESKPLVIAKRLESRREADALSRILRDKLGLHERFGTSTTPPTEPTAEAVLPNSAK